MCVEGGTHLDDGVRTASNLPSLPSDGGLEISDLLVEQLLALGNLDGLLVLRIGDGAFVVVVSVVVLQ